MLARDPRVAVSNLCMWLKILVLVLKPLFRRVRMMKNYLSRINKAISIGGDNKIRIIVQENNKTNVSNLHNKMMVAGLHLS